MLGHSSIATTRTPTLTFFQICRIGRLALWRTRCSRLYGPRATSPQIFLICGTFLFKKSAVYKKPVEDPAPLSLTSNTNPEGSSTPPREQDVPMLLQGINDLPLEISLHPPQETFLSANPHAPRPDFVLIARWEDSKRLFLVEYKSSSTPKALEAAIQQARRSAEVESYLPMVVVPYLSPRALDRLREEKVSGIDLSGNCLVVVPGEWFIRSTGAKNRYPAGAPIKNVYRGTSSLVARVFFARSAFPSVQGVLTEIRSRGGKTTLSTVSKALKGLEEDLLVGRGEVIRVLQPDRLLEVLLENYRTPVVRRRLPIKVTDREGNLRQFARNARKSDVYVAGDLPSRYVVLPTTDDVTRVYASSLGAVTEGVEFEEYSRFPNVELVEIEDQTVYFDLDEEDGIPWISALQTYLILASGGKREQEAAAQIRPDLIAAAGGTDRGVGGEPG